MNPAPSSMHRGAGVYARLGMETTALSASPVQLICMLFEGAAGAIAMARHHLVERQIAAKGAAISRAINIIENGLKASLDATAGGAAGAHLVANLSALYDYAVRRLMAGNLHDDAEALDEAARLLESVASAWRELAAPVDAQRVAVAAGA